MESREELEEERRLFYVGVTRAEDRLLVTHADRRWRYGSEMPAEPSSFLAELPEGPVHYRSMTARPRGRSPQGGRARRHASSGSAQREPGAFGDPSRSVSAGGAWADGGGSRFEWHRGGKRASHSGGHGLRYDYADSQEDLRLEAGAGVVHPRFGGGRILSISGEGKQTRAEIEFEDGVRRKVMVAHAGLRPA